MRGCDTLKNGEPISAIFLTESMREDEVRPFRCPHCNHIGPDVLRFEVKIGGSDETIIVICCSDLEACQRRQGKEK